MSDTVKGIIIFFSAIVTIGLWAPLSSTAERSPSGTIITETFFGPLHYMTVHTELKEPHYEMTPRFSAGRCVATVLITAGLWGAVIWQLRKRGRRPADGADAQ